MPHPLVTETHLRVETMDSKFTSIQVGCHVACGCGRMRLECQQPASYDPSILTILSGLRVRSGGPTAGGASNGSQLRRENYIHACMHTYPPSLPLCLPHIWLLYLHATPTTQAALTEFEYNRGI